MSGLELRQALLNSGTGVAKFVEHVDHLFVNGDVSGEEVVKALESAPRDLSTTIAKAKELLAAHHKLNPVKVEEPKPEPVAEVLVEPVKKHVDPDTVPNATGE